MALKPEEQAREKIDSLPTQARWVIQELVKLYSSGLSYNRCARLKGVSHTTARRWVAQYTAALPERPETQATVVELDEQCAQLGKKEKQMPDLEGRRLHHGQVD